VVNITIDKDGIEFSGTNDEGVLAFNIRLSKNDEGLKDGIKDLQVVDGTAPSAQFALALLSKIGKAGNLTDSVVLSLAKECPLKLDFFLAGDNGTENWGAMTFYIAPKFDDAMDG